MIILQRAAMVPWHGQVSRITRPKTNISKPVSQRRSSLPFGTKEMQVSESQGFSTSPCKLISEEGGCLYRMIGEKECSIHL